LSGTLNSSTLATTHWLHKSIAYCCWWKVTGTQYKSMAMLILISI